MTQLLVRQRMRAQEVAVRKALTADVTAVHGLLHVDRLVYGERARLAETFAAVSARERLLFRVDVPEKVINLFIYGFKKSILHFTYYL